MRLGTNVIARIAVYVTLGQIPCGTAIAEQTSYVTDSSSDLSQPPMTVEDMVHNRHASTDVERLTGRWFDVSTAAVAARYRLLVPADDAARTSQAQSTMAFRGRLKLDEPGRYAIHAGAATGRGFRGGWNDTGIGTGESTYALSLKELFVAARPFDALELQSGGLYVLRGESTEATSYDNDGYLVGERLTMRHVGTVLDEIAVTRAFLGDLADANVLTRLRRLDRANYYQVLAHARISADAAISVEYTWQAGNEVIRAATIFDTRRAVIIDRVHFENYVRIDAFPAYGYAVTAQKRLVTGLMAGYGVSSVDVHYGGLNSDLNGTGQRVFGSMSVLIRGGWVGSVQVARAIGDGPVVGPRTRVDVGLGYDLIRAVMSARVHR